MFSVKRVVSKFRKIYEFKFLFRCASLILSALLLIFAPGQYDVMSGWNFFREFSVFHVLWLVWMGDMLLQIFPSRKFLPIGSTKFSLKDFVPAEIKNIRNVQNLVEYIKKCNRDTIKIGLAWFALCAIVGILYFTGIIGRNLLLLITVAFMYATLSVCFSGALSAYGS